MYQFSFKLTSPIMKKIYFQTFHISQLSNTKCSKIYMIGLISFDQIF